MVGTEAALHRVTRADAVVFLDFDQHLLAPRFGAAEEALALLARASRLVGGRQAGGRILVQTRIPDHEALQAAFHADPSLLAGPERKVREELALPPFGVLALLRGPGSDDYAAALRGTDGLTVSASGPERWLVRAGDHRTLCDTLAATPRPPGPPAGGGRPHRRLSLPTRCHPRDPTRRMEAMSSYSVRKYGDPVLKQAARPVDQIDGTLAHLVDDMVETMYDAVGAGLAAPQVGVQKRVFVYDVGDGPVAVINPTIVETAGEWYYEEGCLSIPDLRLGIVRPMTVHLRGYNLEGEEVSIEADEFLGRVFQHEVDHLDGVLMVERLEDDMRKQALKVLRDRSLGLDTTALEATLVSASSSDEREI